MYFYRRGLVIDKIYLFGVEIGFCVEVVGGGVRGLEVVGEGRGEEGVEDDFGIFDVVVSFG